MKLGMRKPSLSKTLKAKTTGKLKRSIKKAVNPVYGKKGMGLVQPKKAVYNKVYKKTSFDLLKLLGIKK
jgi:Skp family chaperone for outer membrane proteins